MMIGCVGLRIKGKAKKEGNRDKGENERQIRNVGYEKGKNERWGSLKE